MSEVVVTKELLDSGRSKRGAWNRPQVEALGQTWPPKRGWAKKLTGKRIAKEQVEAFLSLKDVHYAKMRSKQSTVNGEKVAPSTATSDRMQSPTCSSPPPPTPSEDVIAGGFVVIKTQAGAMCEAVLRTIYPMRELFTRAQIADAGYFIKRIGYDQTCKIADWAARNVTIKDGRYRVWLSVCRKTIAKEQA